MYRPSGFTKYRLHNRIPRNAAEAERFLWHACFHIANVYENTTSDYVCDDAKQANAIIGQAIEQLQEEQ